MSFHVSAERIRADIEHLATIGATATGGVSRTSFSAADRQVRAWVADQCARFGLAMHTDGIGNIFITWGGDAQADRAPVYAGSHLDSVPEGGRFDGILGSVAALEVVRTLSEQQVSLARPVGAIIFADEEGNYHHLLGSTALTDGYAWAELQTFRGRDGDLLVDALARMGWDPQAATGVRLAPQDVHAFLELHIEQGPVLEAAGVDIGIVTSIVGLAAGQLEFIGRQDHAGTTPMDQRADPMQAAGVFLAGLHDIAARGSATAVLTCGLLEVTPGGTNVVPERVRLHLDFRDPDLAVIHALEQAIIEAADRAGAEHGITAAYERQSITSPVPLNSELQDLVEARARSRGLRALHLASDAGHDSQNMARLTSTGMIFVPSVGGRSHSPQELTEWKDTKQGANVLLDVVYTLAREAR
ncbi:Zn-dependent hydrolase [Ornithinimicrobium faecis]|uniref:Zn-dependent hydrolase n=1 Tax=Ornithinimicrobium faecis TaxID=2934158 RepID=UPI0021181E04|nr:Zn-dependent hydrolase [Ornithinimicrobium sp. HY1745]